MTPPDHAELPEQDPEDFRRALGRRPMDRKRLQEIGETMPGSDGIGAELDQARYNVAEAQAVLRAATAEAGRLSSILATRLGLLTEERRLLEANGLTANLYRHHEPTDGYEGNP